MSLRIIKGTESIPVDHPVFLIFGQPGIGKSSLGYSAKDPLTLDFDSGAHRAANRKDTLVINTWSDVTEWMGTPDALEYATIVVDTVGRCLDVMTADIALNDPKKAPGGNLSQQGWGVLKNRFRSWTSQIRALGKDTMLIAHDKEDKDNDFRIVRPDIVGGSFSEVMKVSDFVGYLYMNGKDRILDFSPTDKWIGKNPGGWPPFKVPPVNKAQSFMAELFDRGREALGKISEASSEVALQVEEWRAAILTYTAPEEFNRAIPDIQKTPPIIQPQVKKILMAHAASKGIVFDLKAKQFIETSAESVI